MRRSTQALPGTGEPDASRTAGRGNFTPPSAVTEPPGDDRPETSGTGSRFAPRNWRVATRLNAILLIPVLVALVFGGLRVQSSYDTWREAQDAERIAQLVRAATAYGHALIDERDVSAEPLLGGDENSPVVETARRTTGQAREEFHDRVADLPDNDSLRHRLSLFTEVEPKLPGLREVAYTEQTEGVQTEEGYVEVQHPLMSFSNEMGLGTGNVTTYGRTVYALSLSKAASSLQRAIGTHLLVAPGPGEQQTRIQLTAFTSYAYLENIARAEYVSAGTPQDSERLEEAMAKAAAAVPGAPDLDTMVQLIASGATPAQLAEQGLTPEVWFRVSTAKFDAYREVEEELVDAAVTEAQDVAAAARQDMIVNAAIVLTALLVAFVIAALMAHAMSQSMRRLRTAALQVAEERLPSLVDQLSRTEPGAVDQRVTPIPIDSKDEIGEVARAFDRVHGEAVRLAGEQAMLRGNVNAIFTNLSSRNQGLIERQLALITDLENNEADPDQLENLFRLDHLATRMRRNGENLLVLAGEEPGRRWTQPVPLVDVIRAAASEVEAYDRVEISGVPESEIHGAVVTDLVHLLAELLENATTFSSPQTKVRVTATRLPDGRIMIEIHDKGIGLTPEDFAEINHRLAQPPAVDAAVSRRMGLFVVGRLSERHGIRVQLRPSGEQSGTTSLVMLPEVITHGGGPLDEEQFTVSRIVPEGPMETPEQAGLRTAAELGFDDTRYQRAGQGADESPAERALRREERRALLESQQQPEEPPQPAYEDQGYPGHGQGFPDRAFGRQDVPEQQGYGQGYPEAREDAYGQPAGDGSPYHRNPAQDPHHRGQPEQQFGAFPGRTESAHDAPAGSGQRVGFNGPDPVPADPYANSDGFPRGDLTWQQSEEVPAQRPREEPGDQASGEAPWDRGPRREVRTEGTTSSGLPKRVPRANLTEHSTEQQPVQGGPQISRDPDEVRGRLSNLHRGVRRGRGAGTGRTRNDQQGFGPGNTYDQER
ncbi:nitrate- and nitrite sensing domain-containing protein [Streptomyces sodiiphilus]|uniref:histidine kinase n=1 Tax=Streptomyces sodiiphilus TaxID=226217 RepID=A0ABN2PVW5_9ACTN